MPVDNSSELSTFPVLALRGLVAFPKMMLTLDVGRKKSVKALSIAMDKNKPIYLVTQKNIIDEEPENDGLYPIGCVCRVRQVLKMPDGGAKVLVQGLYRAHHLTFADNGEYYISTVEKCQEKPIKNRAVYVESLLRKIKNEFEAYAAVSGNMAKDIVLSVATNDDLSFLSDYIAFNIPAPFDDKQFILEQLNPVSRAKILLKLITKEREVTEIDNRIAKETRMRLDDNQKDYYLKEQMRVISDELYGDGGEDEIEAYFDKLDKLKASTEIKDKIRTEIQKLSKMPQGAHEGTVQRNFLDLALSLPYGVYDNVKVDMSRSEKILERDFYGLKKVKERILEMLSVFALSPDITGQILCLAGPPGVGKTSIGKTIAECMGRKYVRVSLGGMHDEAEIRGHRKTYVGAMPGKIISAIKQAGTSNPLILLDEIDKLGSDYKGDPASALLEVLDPEQNKAFCDNFLEIPYDLSHVVFVTTANNVDTIPAPLLDRMELITIEGYTREEKFNIAKKHLIAKEVKSHALKPSQIRLADSAVYGIIDNYTREAGVRKLSRAIGSLCGKAAKQIASDKAQKVSVKESDLKELLGPKKYKPDMIPEKDTVGLINGLAWTQVGGEIMQMEASVMQGSGKIELTGSLGDVMQESAKAAISFVRANADKYGIDPDFYKTRDIHIHATEAAVPKDGPSAGVTMATVLVSALTEREVRRDVAMTGEITLRGRVLAIGGLKEKAMAAYRGGVKTVFIPKDNIPDIEEVDEAVRNGLKFIPVSDVKEVIEGALVPISEKQGDTQYRISENKKSAAISQ